MVRLFSLLVLYSFAAHADFFGFGSQQGHESKIPAMVEKLKTLEMAATPAYEETFNQTVKNIENAMEEEKIFCSGEATDAKGRVIPKEQKQLCFRELKTLYLDVTDTIFTLKKKYLGVIHTRQIEKLSDIQKKQKADIEKSF
jgi:hypothetical protein